jgi:hypothetical protein
VVNFEKDAEGFLVTVPVKSADLGASTDAGSILLNAMRQIQEQMGIEGRAANADAEIAAIADAKTKCVKVPS